MRNILIRQPEEIPAVWDFTGDNDLSDKCRVSVVIPCWRAEDTIGETVRSVLAQTETSLEVILVISGEMDESVLPTDSRIRMIRSGEKLSSAAARRTGVRNAMGSYVAFLDADDLWDKDKLRLEIKMLQRKNKKGESPLLVFTGRQLIREDGKPLGRYIPARRIVTYRDLLKTNSISCSSVLMLRETAERLVYPEGRLHEDYAAWLELFRTGGYAAGIDRPLLFYRVRRGSRSGVKTRSAAMHWRTLRFHGLSACRSAFCMVSYVLHGIKKYYL